MVSVLLLCHILLLLCYLRLVLVAETPDGRLSCPATKWRDGDTQVLKCTVKVAKYSNSTCLQFPDIVDFQFTAKDKTFPASECAVYGITETCEGHFLSKHCRCREVSDGCYILEFAVTARRELHEGGSWTCVPGCSDRFLRNPFLHGDTSEALSCGPVEFDDCESSAPPSFTSQDLTKTTIAYVTTFMTFSFQPFVMTQVFYLMNFL